MILTLLLIIIYISFISLGLPDSLLGAAWPSIYKDFGVPVSYAGFVSLITAGATIVSSMMSVRLIRKLGTGKVTAISVLMTAIALLGISFSNSFLPICILAIPLGLGAGSVDAALNNYVALHYKAKHMNWLHCFWGIGATLGPVIISVWIALDRWDMGYRSISIFQFVLVAILFLSLPLWKRAEEHYKENIKEEQKQKNLSTREIMKLPGVKTALITFYCYCSIEITVGLWGSSFLVISREIDAKTAAGWISLYYLGITAGRFLSGLVTMKLNQSQMIRLGEVFLTIGIALLFIPGTSVFLLPGLFLIGLGCAPIFPSLLHETPINFGTQNSQSVMGLQMASAYVGGILTPPVFGFLANAFGYGLFQYFIGGFLIIMIIMVEKLHNRVKNNLQ